jgi:hypothetical protein
LKYRTDQIIFNGTLGRDWQSGAVIFTTADKIKGNRTLSTNFDVADKTN